MLFLELVFPIKINKQSCVHLKYRKLLENVGSSYDIKKYSPYVALRYLRCTCLPRYVDAERKETGLRGHGFAQLWHPPQLKQHWSDWINADSPRPAPLVSPLLFSFSLYK